MHQITFGIWEEGLSLYVCVCKEGKEGEGKEIDWEKFNIKTENMVFLSNFITELKMGCYVTMHMSVGMGY